MSDFDQKQWDEIARWHEKRAYSRSLPARLQPLANRATELSDEAKNQFGRVPGASTIQAVLGTSLASLTDLVGKVAEASVRREAVLKAYGKAGHEVREVEDIRSLALVDVLKVKPRLDLHYSLAATAEGAAAGAALSGGTLLAGAGVIAGGVGVAPGVGTIVGVMAADTAAVMGAASRLISHTAAYYGYDTSIPGESVIASEVMNFALAGNAATKNGVYQQLNKVVQDLAHRATWKQLNEHAAVKVVQKVYQALGVRLTQKKLAQAVPVLGIAVGAGMNARMLSTIADAADHFYRERFLRDKYGIPFETSEPELSSDEGDVIDVVAIVEEELTAEGVGESVPSGAEKL